MNDIVIVLVLTFPMFLFTIYPGIWLSDYAEEHFNVNETKKRAIMVSVTFLGAFLLSSLLYWV